MSKPASPPTVFEPVAGILAIMAPGLGYLWYGEPRRALYTAIGVLGLFVGGLLVGGISVVDRVEDRWWFYLQTGVGPITLVIDHLHQTRYKEVTAGGRMQSPLPARAKPGYQKSLGKVNEVGALSCGLAGMLNLIAVVDCLFHMPRDQRRKPITKL